MTPADSRQIAPAGGRDLAACRSWRPSLPFHGVFLGICPRLNAVALLNRAAACVWDALASGEGSEGAARHLMRLTGQHPDAAHDHVAALLARWEDAGFLALEAPDTPRPGTEAVPAAPVGEARTLRFGGGAVEIRIADGRLREILFGLLAGVPETDAAPDTTITSWRSADGRRAIALGGTVIAAGLSLVDARAVLLGLILDHATRSPRTARLHAASVSDGTHTLLLVGPSGAGKSTLAAALRARGWRQLADDVCPLDEGLRIHPLPFAASIKDGAVDALAATYAGLAGAPRHEIGRRGVRYLPLAEAAGPPRPVRPTHIVRVRYDASAAPAVAALSPTETLLEILSTESFIDFESPSADNVLRWLETAPAFQMRYPSIPDALTLIGEILATDIC